jgi:hypothetical protein
MLLGDQCGDDYSYGWEHHVTSASLQCEVAASALGWRGVHAACRVFLANDNLPCMQIFPH